MGLRKKGLDSFPMPVSMDIQDEVMMLEAKYGIEGFCIFVKLQMAIYNSGGYFMEWDEKTSLLLAKRVNVNIEKLNVVIEDLVRWRMFDQKRFEKYQILTSCEIQKTYIEQVGRRKGVEMFDPYILVSEVGDNITVVFKDGEVNPNKNNAAKNKVDVAIVDKTTTLVKKTTTSNKKRVESDPMIEVYDDPADVIGDSVVQVELEDNIRSKEIADEFLGTLEEREAAKVTPAILSKWIDTILKCVRIDKYTYDEVEAVLRWTRQHDFWSVNVQSPMKLRKKDNNKVLYISRLLKEMKADKGSGSKIQKIASSAQRLQEVDFSKNRSYD